jgi:hypothetical protein
MNPSSSSTTTDDAGEPRQVSRTLIDDQTVNLIFCAGSSLWDQTVLADLQDDDDDWTGDTARLFAESDSCGRAAAPFLIPAAGHY